MNNYKTTIHQTLNDGSLPYGPMEICLNGHNHNGYNSTFTLPIEKVNLSHVSVEIPEGTTAIHSLPPLESIPIDLESQEHFEDMHVIGEMLHEFWEFMPQILVQFPHILEIMTACDNRLEMDFLKNNPGYFPNIPQLIKVDCVLDQYGNVVGFDPNTVPLGLAALHAVPAAESMYGIERNVTNLEPLIQSLHEIIGEGTLGIITLPSRGLLNHNYIQNLLQDQGIDAHVVYPNQLIENTQGTLSFIDANSVIHELDVLMNYTRAYDSSYSDEVQAGINLYMQHFFEGNVALLFEPGLRIYETQLWQAIIRMNAVHQFFIDSGKENLWILLSHYTPASNILMVDENGKQYGVHVTTNGIEMNELSNTNVLPGFSGRAKIVVKEMSTSGSKGVFMTKIIDIRKLLINNGLTNIPMIVQENLLSNQNSNYYQVNNGIYNEKGEMMYALENGENIPQDIIQTIKEQEGELIHLESQSDLPIAFSHKLEYWFGIHNNSTYPIGYGVMTTQDHGVPVHGGSNTTYNVY